MGVVALFILGMCGTHRILFFAQHIVFELSACFSNRIAFVDHDRSGIHKPFLPTQMLAIRSNCFIALVGVDRIALLARYLPDHCFPALAADRCKCLPGKTEEVAHKQTKKFGWTEGKTFSGRRAATLPTALRSRPEARHRVTCCDPAASAFRGSRCRCGSEGESSPGKHRYCPQTDGMRVVGKSELRSSHLAITTTTPIIDAVAAASGLFGLRVDASEPCAPLTTDAAASSCVRELGDLSPHGHRRVRPWR